MHPRQNLSFSTVSVILGKVLKVKEKQKQQCVTYQYVYDAARLRRQELLIPPVSHCLLGLVGRTQRKVDGSRQMC